VDDIFKVHAKSNRKEIFTLKGNVAEFYSSSRRKRQTAPENNLRNSLSDRVSVKRMRRVQTTPLQNGSGMGDGFDRRHHLVDGFAHHVLAISRAEVDGGRSWIPSSTGSFSGTCPGVCRWIAFECGCKLSRLEQVVDHNSDPRFR
jgi:hypothetical protein